MANSFLRRTFVIPLIASVILAGAGCGRNSADGSSGEPFSENSGKMQSTAQEAESKASEVQSTPQEVQSKASEVQSTPQEVQPSSDYHPTESIELSNYVLMNIDIAHDNLSGTRYDSEGVITYITDEPGDIFVTYANSADQGMEVTNIYLEYTGDYRAGESKYSLFGCQLGDTATDVHNKLMNYGFESVETVGDYEYLNIYDGEWNLSYKCDNGFLSMIEVNARKRTVEQALESELKSGYYVAALTGHPTNSAYIDNIYTSDGNASIAFSGVFEEGSSENSDMHMTEYMTFTVFPDENTVYAGRDEFDLYYYSEEEFIDIMKSFNGLGVALTVENGTLVQAILMS